MKNPVRSAWRWAVGNLMIVFVIALVFGAIIKVEAAKYVTIGYNDYKVSDNAHDYDFREMEKTSAKRAAENGGATTPSGAACGI